MTSKGKESQLRIAPIQDQTQEQLRPEELKRLSDFFALLIKINLRQSERKDIATKSNQHTINKQIANDIEHAASKKFEQITNK